MKTKQELLDLLKSNSKPYGLMIKEDWWCDEALAIFEDARIRYKLTLLFSNNGFINRDIVDKVNNWYTYGIQYSYELPKDKFSIQDLYEFKELFVIDNKICFSIGEDDNRQLHYALSFANFIGILYTKDIPTNFDELRDNLVQSLDIETITNDNGITRIIPNWVVFKK